MPNRLVKLTHTAYVPAVAEVPARPARCVQTGGTYRLYSPSGISEWVIGTGRQALPGFSYPVTIVCYPATPGVPGRDAVLSTDANEGWNGGAVSIAVAFGDAQAKFEIAPWSVGALVGFAAYPASGDQFAGVTHGLLYAGDTLRVVESGVEVADSGIVLTGATKTTITRLSGQAKYEVDGWSYTSAAPSTGPVQLAAILYMGGDAVDSPSLVDLATLSARSSWGWSDPYSDRLVRAGTDWGWGGSATVNDARLRVDMDMPALASEDPRGDLRVDAGDVVVSGVGGFVAVEATGISTVVPVNAYSIGTSVIGGDIDTSIDMSVAAYEDEYANVVGEVADLRSLGVEYDEAEGSGSSYDLLRVADTYLLDPVLYVNLRSALRVGSTFEVLLVLDADLAERLMLLDACDISAVIEAALRSGVRFTDNASVVRSELLQYATNILTGAVTRYSGFDFEGFARRGQVSYGWKADGVYRIGAATDNGELISAALAFAAEDFSTSERKRLETVYLGLATDGQVFVKTTDEAGSEVTYRVRSRSEGTYRGVLGQKRSSRTWRMELQVVDASYAELTDVEWVSGATGRRTTR